MLAVDDDPQELRYVRDTLANAGYSPLVTGDPEEAVRLMQEERPRLALLDLVLPDTDGIELMKSLLRIADIPVIFLSAYGRDDTIARAFEEGAVDYVVKPFSPTELAARIGAALRRREVAEPLEPYVRGGLVIDYQQAAPPAGRRRRPPHLRLHRRLHRAPDRLLGAAGGDGTVGGAARLDDRLFPVFGIRAAVGALSAKSRYEIGRLSG